MNGRLAVGVGVGAVVLAFDQVTKEVFESRPCGDVIYPLRNDELMLGVVGATTTQVLAASVISLALFWHSLRVASRRATVPSFAPALVVSGTIGNLIDRVFRADVALRPWELCRSRGAALLGYRQSLAMTLMAVRHEVGQDRMMVARVASVVGESGTCRAPGRRRSARRTSPFR